ncbi:MAG: type II toxin-antitoxin system VapC family toxin [Acidimicrobiia bacterium]
MTIVDTSVWIDFFRGADSRQVERLVGLIESDEGVGITDVILAELLQGMTSVAAATSLDRQMSHFDVFELGSLDDFRRAAYLYRQARRRGQTIRRTLDCLIASVCIRESLPILHSDSDFDRLAVSTDLRIVMPLSGS